MNTTKRLSKVLTNAKVIPFDKNSRFVLMSDCHRGDGTWSDNFSKNQNVFFAALTYYYEQGFTYIELGDGDELWENRKMNTIISIHSDVFWLMSKLYEEGRFFMIYGNHDMIKKNVKYMNNFCRTFYNEGEQCYCNLFPDIQASEGILLKSVEDKKEIFLIHGHQGDLINDTLWKVSRFLVRYLWKPLELIAVHDPTSAAKNYMKKGIVEKRISRFADKEKQIIIAGHTHRPVFPEPGTSKYFNDGSCVHPRCITAIEIIQGQISLVKWTVMTREDRSMYVGKEILAGPVLLDYYFKEDKEN